jgi:hypothetical protein
VRKVALGALGAVAAALAVCVGIGMSQNADPHFEKGVSPTSTVITQEVIGAVAIAVLTLTLYRVVRAWRGKDARSLLILFPAGLVLVLAWGFALLVQRAS